MDQTTQEALPQEEIDQKRATAEDLLAQLQAITDPAELETKFDELMNQYSEDTGLKPTPTATSLPAARWWSPSRRAPGPWTTARSAASWRATTASTSSSGWTRREVELIRSDWALNQLSQQSTQWVEEAEIVTTETYDNLNVGDFYEKLTTYRDALNGTEESDSTSDTQDTSGSDTQTQEETSDTQADANTQEETSDTQADANTQEGGRRHRDHRRGG